MDEMNELTVAEETEVATCNEATAQEDTDVKYVDADVVFVAGAIAGAAALKGAQMLWNCKPVKKARTWTADKLTEMSDNAKAKKEERQRKKLAKVQGDIIDAEVIPAKEAVNE